MCCHCVNSPQHFADHQYIPTVCFLFPYNIDATGAYECKNPAPDPHFIGLGVCRGADKCFGTQDRGKDVRVYSFFCCNVEILTFLRIIV